MKKPDTPSIGGVVDFVLATTHLSRPTDDHEHDLVMLGTLAAGRAFWPCRRWGVGQQRSDFVHVAQPCRDLDAGS